MNISIPESIDTQECGIMGGDIQDSQVKFPTTVQNQTWMFFPEYIKVPSKINLNLFHETTPVYSYSDS